jgi:hypothetical protein
MHSLKLFLLSFSFLFLVTAASAQDRIVKGQAKDTSSTPIYKATVQLFYPSGSDTLKTITNNVGSFSFQGVKAGPFVIKISNSGFLPFQKKFDNSEMIIDAGDIYAFYSVSASATKLRIATAGKNRVVVTIAAANPRR